MNRHNVMAARLRKARMANGLSQQDLAAIVPCSVHTIRNYESSGRISISMAVAMARVLHVKPAWLLDLEE